MHASPADDTALALIRGLHAQLPPGPFVLAGIEVALGALVDLTAEGLRAALEAALPGVEVRVTMIPAVLRCLDCGAEYPADEHPCPVCGSVNATLIHGDELTITRAWGAPG